MPFESNDNFENHESDLKPADMLGALLQAYLDAKAEGVSSEVVERIRTLLGGNSPFAAQLPLANIEDLWKRLSEKFGQYGVGRSLDLNHRGESFYFAGGMGQVQKLPNGPMVQVGDPQGFLDRPDSIQKNLISSFFEVAKGLRGQNAFDFKANIDLMENLTVFVMDPGVHKEYLVCLAPTGEKPGCVYYQHVKSTNERRRPNIRADYIKGCLAGFEIHENDQAVSALRTFSGDDPDFEDESYRLMRLAASVKNLDMLSKNEADAAKMSLLFDEGALNMMALWPLFREKMPLMPERNYGINEEEAKGLQSIFDGRKKLADSFDGNFEMFRRRLDLNFKALALLTQFQGGMDDLENGPIRHGAKQAVRRLESLLEDLRKTVTEFACMTFEYPNRGRDLVNRVFSDPRLTDSISSALGRLETGSEIGGSCRELSGRLSFLGKEVKQDSEIQSVHELIRYLHQISIGWLFYELSYRGRIENTKSPLFETVLGDVHVLDLTLEVKMTDSPFYKEIDRLMSSFVDMQFGCDGEQKTRTAFLGDRFVEIHMPMGKHLAEVIARKLPNGEVLMSFRYFESGYHHSGLRQDFTKNILEDLGFRVQINNRMLTADQTFKEADWEKVFGHVLRLPYAMSNLDMGNAVRWFTPDKFLKGVTNYFRCSLFIEDVLGGDPEADDQSGAKAWERWDYLDDREKKWAVGHLYEGYCDWDPLNFINYAKEIDENLLDKVISVVFDIQDEAERSKDESTFAKYADLGNVLDKFYEKRFPGPLKVIGLSEQGDPEKDE